MPSVELIQIGTELLLGDVQDANGPFVARTLAQYGVDVFAMHTVGDNSARIAAAVRGALERADGVVVCGGLGPTEDDVTREAIASALGVALEENAQALRAMETRFRESGRAMPENNRKQALSPRGFAVLENPQGTAPGFVAVQGRKFVAALPGVPHEMRAMLAESLIPWMRTRFALETQIHHRTLHCVDIAESAVDARLHELIAGGENPKVGLLAHDGMVDVKLTVKSESANSARALLAPLESEIRLRLGKAIFGSDDESLPAVVLTVLKRRGLTLAVAESCTGGAVCDWLVSVPGAADSFRGGVVAYDNGVKRDILGVEDGTLARLGAVSKDVAVQMARGVRERLGAQIGVSTTGLAGPSGGSEEKPVGLVWFALADGDAVHTLRRQFSGDRATIQRRATITVLAFLWDHLQRWRA